MWIRSQNKRLLMNVDTSDGMLINEYPDECLISLEHDKSSYDLGRYSSKEKALKVLDRIEELIQYQYKLTFCIPADDEVVTVKKEVDEFVKKLKEQEQ